MLAASHNRAYQDFMTLLTTFRQNLSAQEQKNHQSLVTQEFQSVVTWFEQNLVSLGVSDIEPAIASRWQAVQTEILREFKLLSTDILFLAAARQQTTQQTRLQSIDNRLTKLISYCQIMIKDLK